jgi:Ca2+-binding RTX toxin-like protein
VLYDISYGTDVYGMGGNDVIVAHKDDNTGMAGSHQYHDDYLPRRQRIGHGDVRLVRKGHHRESRYQCRVSVLGRSGAVDRLSQQHRERDRLEASATRSTDRTASTICAAAWQRPHLRLAGNDRVWGDGGDDTLGGGNGDDLSMAASATTTSKAPWATTR